MSTRSATESDTTAHPARGNRGAATAAATCGAGRPRNGIGPLLTGFALLLTVSPAAAKESSQWFAVEFKAGPYSPNMDDEFGGGSGTGPFEQMFGSGTGLLFGGEVDVQLFNGFGSVGLGFSATYYSKSADSCVDDTQDDPSDPLQWASCDERVEGDKTSLSMVPMALLGVYRFDVLADRWVIPLVPHAKIGMTYTLWWIRRGDGSVAEFTEEGSTEVQRGRGGVFGWQFNAGVGLRLDHLDPGAARVLDGDYGINHTMLTFELLHSRSFGTPELGDTTFTGGLALEF